MTAGDRTPSEPREGARGKRRSPSHPWSSSSGWRSWYRPRVGLQRAAAALGLFEPARD